MFHYLFERVNRFYENIFEKYGRFISKYYIYTIVGAFFLNLFLSAGMLRFNMIKDTDVLFMPQDSQARQDERLVKYIFNESARMTGDFFLHQILDLGTWAEVNFQTCESNENILGEEYIEQIRGVNQFLLANSLVQVNNSDDSQVIGLEQVCARRNGKCLIDGLDLLSEEFYKRWLKSSMVRKQRFYDEQEIFEKSASSIANEFRLANNEY